MRLSVRIGVLLSLLAVAGTSCTHDYEYPDQVPQRGVRWLDPPLRASIVSSLRGYSESLAQMYPSFAAEACNAQDALDSELPWRQARETTQHAMWTASGVVEHLQLGGLLADFAVLPAAHVTAAQADTVVPCRLQARPECVQAAAGVSALQIYRYGVAGASAPDRVGLLGVLSAATIDARAGAAGGAEGWDAHVESVCASGSQGATQRAIEGLTAADAESTVMSIFGADPCRAVLNMQRDAARGLGRALDQVERANVCELPDFAPVL